MTDSTVSILDLIIKGIALLSGGAFFVWKAVSGYNNQNLSLSLQCSRVAQHSDKEPPDDLVLLSISIEKGTTSALALEGLEARFSWIADEDKPKHIMLDIYRQAIGPTPQSKRDTVLWQPDTSRPYLYLAPGEKTSFGCSAAVPSTTLCQVDVVAFGRRRKSAFQAQWRASAIVPMLPKKIATAE